MAVRNGSRVVNRNSYSCFHPKNSIGRTSLGNLTSFFATHSRLGVAFIGYTSVLNFTDLRRDFFRGLDPTRFTVEPNTFFKKEIARKMKHSDKSSPPIVDTGNSCRYPCAPYLFQLTIWWLAPGATQLKSLKSGHCPKNTNPANWLKCQQSIKAKLAGKDNRHLNQYN